MTTAWNTLNILLLVAAIGVTSEKKEVRKSIRIPLNSECTIFLNGVAYKGTIIDISEGGVNVIPLDETIKYEEIFTASPSVEIELADVDGEPFKIPSTFLKSFNWGKKLVFIFEDMEFNIPLRQKLVQIIYGNTTKWQEIEDGKPIMTPGVSFMFIIRQSFKNAMFKEAYIFTFHKIKNYILRGNR